MKKIKQFMLVLLCFLSIIPNIAYASNINKTEGSIDTPYVFPIVPGSKEWDDLEKIQDKINACQVPEEVLSRLSTLALLETISNYPLAVNLYAYDSLEVGYSTLKDQFNGLREFELRMKCFPEETASYVKVYMQSIETSKVSENDFKLYFMNRIIEATESAPVYALSSSYVYTPNGSSVQAYSNLSWSDMGISQTEAYAAHNQVLSTYSSVTALRYPNPKYNCHSYAWHSTSSSNSYWINDPSTYITDGSYSRVYNYYVGAKLLYGTPGSSPEHSAIISGVSNNHLTYVTSKWGALGLYKHLYYDCPYSSGVKSYR